MTKLFLTAEVTADIPFETRKIIVEYEDVFNSLAGKNLATPVDTLVIIFVIMNPDICLPFQESVRFLNSKSRLDFRIKLDHIVWRSSTNMERVNIITNTILVNCNNFIIKKSWLQLAEYMAAHAHKTKIIFESKEKGIEGPPL